ncbi:hypothetical protein [Amaricoccus tamworthensis]
MFIHNGRLVQAGSRRRAAPVENLILAQGQAFNGAPTQKVRP